MTCGQSFDGNYVKSLERVRKDPEVGEENRKLILEFADKCFADGLSKGRLCKLLYTARYLAHFLNKPFPQATKKDIQGVVAEIEKCERYAAWTKYDFKVILKKFYKWLKGNDELFPEEVRWIHPSVRGSKRTLPEELVTEDEVKRMAEAAMHPRDKALVMVLYESGCRIGEIMSLKLKNVQFDEYGAVLRVTGKTGDRRVRVVASAPLLASWFDVHPSRSDPNAAVWVGRYRRYSGHVPSYASLLVVLRGLAVKAGVKRRIYPHLFRHSRATNLASKLTEAQMKEHFGWVQSSKMASVYVHLSGRDVDNAILQTYGLVNKELTAPDEKFVPKNCPRCKTANSPISKFCSCCGFVLDAETVYQAESERKKADDLMNLLMKDPEFKKMAVAKLLASGAVS